MSEGLTVLLRVLKSRLQVLLLSFMSRVYVLVMNFLVVRVLLNINARVLSRREPRPKTVSHAETVTVLLCAQ